MCVVVAYKCQFLKAIHSGIWGKCVLRIWFMRVPHKLICNCRASKIHKQTNEPSNDRRTDKETSRQREREREKQRRRLSRQRNEEFSTGTRTEESNELQPCPAPPLTPSPSPYLLCKCARWGDIDVGATGVHQYISPTVQQVSNTFVRRQSSRPLCVCVSVCV